MGNFWDVTNDQLREKRFFFFILSFFLFHFVLFSSILFFFLFFSGLFFHVSVKCHLQFAAVPTFIIANFLGPSERIYWQIFQKKQNIHCSKHFLSFLTKKLNIIFLLSISTFTNNLFTLMFLCGIPADSILCRDVLPLKKVVSWVSESKLQKIWVVWIIPSLSLIPDRLWTG